MKFHYNFHYSSKGHRANDKHKVKEIHTDLECRPTSLDPKAPSKTPMLKDKIELHRESKPTKQITGPVKSE